MEKRRKKTKTHFFRGERVNGKILATPLDEKIEPFKIHEDELVSMNIWGFTPKVFDYKRYLKRDEETISKIHKAISIIMYKLEGDFALKHPEYNMLHRRLLDKIDYQNKEILIMHIINIIYYNKLNLLFFLYENHQPFSMFIINCFYIKSIFV